MTTPTELPKFTHARDWNKIVSESNGTMFFAPSEFIDRLKAWQEKRLAFNKRVEEVSKLENEISVLFGQLVFDMRADLEKKGIAGVWTADFGFNTEALKEGKFIVNLTPNSK